MRLVLFAMVLALGIELAGGSGVHAASSASEKVHVSTTGDDASCVRGNASRPCASFARAYSLARCDDVVEVAGGTYPVQRLVEVPRLSSCASNVILQSAPAASVRVDGFEFGTASGGYSQDVPDRLTLRGFAVTNGLFVWGDGNDMVWDRIDGGAFYVQGVHNLTIKNSDWGPCGSGTEGTCYTFFSRQNFIGSHSGDPTETSGVVLENNVIHDFDLNREGDHFECIRTDGGRDITLRGNRLFNCETYAMTITQPRGTWLIEDNWFGRTCCYSESPRVDRYSAIVLGDGTAGAKVVIRNNNFGPKQTVLSEGATGFATVQVLRNILQTLDCIPGVTYAGNLFVRYSPDDNTFSAGTSCSATDRTTVFGYKYDGQRLTLDEPRATAVRTAFEALAERTPIGKVRARVRRLAPPPPGGWTNSSITRLVHDPVYLGRNLGMTTRHRALVTRARWNAVQKALGPSKS